MTSQASVESTLDSMAMLLREISFAGRTLFEVLSPSLQALGAGRSPRALGLEEKLQETGGLLGAIQEIEAEAEPLLAIAPSQSLDLETGKVAGWLESARTEFSRWKNFRQRVELLLKRLALLAREEKITSLGKAPILEAWEEVKAALPD